MQPHPDSRRLAERFDKRLDVELNLKGGGTLAHTIDVSRHGMFVGMESPPPENHVILLTVHLPQGPFETLATVARREETEEKNGAGFKLFCLASDAKLRWDEFIQSVSGREFSLTPRPAARADSASFIVQLETADEIEMFVNQHVRPRQIVSVTPALKKVGGEILCVLVHPETQAEFLLVARVEELYEKAPHRMGVRFAPLDQAQKRRFRDFLGIDERAKRERRDKLEPAYEQEFVPSKRRNFTEYAFFSPRVKDAADEPEVPTQPAPQPEPEPEVEVKVVRGSSLDMPELELVDKNDLFDFQWDATVDKK